MRELVEVLSFHEISGVGRSGQGKARVAGEGILTALVNLKPTGKDTLLIAAVFLEIWDIRVRQNRRWADRQ